MMLSASFILSTPYLCGYIIHLCERIVLNYERFDFIIHWNIAEMEWKCKTALTEHGASRDRFSVQPEGDLRQNDGHDAREVGLNHEIANFPFQMEIRCHHNIFTCSRRRETERDAWGQSRKSWNIQGKKRSISTSNSLKTPLEVVAGHQNKWRVGIYWSEHISDAWEHSKDNLSIEKNNKQLHSLLWCCLSVMLPAVLWPSTVKISPQHQPFYAMSIICAAKIWEKHSATPRGAFLLERFKPELKWLQFSSSPSSKVYRKYDLFTGSSRSNVSGSRCLHVGFYYLHGLSYCH